MERHSWMVWPFWRMTEGGGNILVQLRMFEEGRGWGVYPVSVVVSSGMMGGIRSLAGCC